ncbi:polypyrimidine tract-binding protein 1-like [Hydractinia symbiolongicarpus]|uniref:polypyrimidine tract-binding protein 1-like n=1 Tax=Hydractinia symbiolongicarpus TaxID=13093 RepID=UPI00254A44F2|nr:polypyrimidine tract-binding protein 1-like [Hydractinia symbiolongicarpus]XP_057299761.1 polypyrimidine tract-binding protein 1-like [Hydractinia symbiolongicarpus]
MSDNSLANRNSVGNKRTHPDDLNDMENNKKVKHEQQTPSKVIHIRQLPHDANEAEVKALGLPFGRVTNMLLMKNKSQAFLELQDVDSAKTMINYYTYVSPTVRNTPVFLQFSQHQELRTNNQNRDVDQQNGGSADSGRQSGRVLKVIVSNIIYPVTIEVLQQVFQRCGDLQKIVTFIRNDQYHALIQYSNPKEAAAAKTLFDHQNIYNGCNTLHVEFSKMTELVVKYNNDKMRDFTKPDRQSLDPMNAQIQAIQAQMNPGMLPVPGSFPPQLFPQGLNLGGGFPGMMGNVSPGSNMNFGQQMMGHHHHGMGSRHGSVLLVSNLTEEEITCDDLFILFGHYGDVQRVKILFNKKDTALIQFADPSQASTALQNLNNITLYGQEMRVSRSKHDNVNMPKAEDEGKELTKDYSNSPLHRFKKPGSKNFQNIFQPIRTLHLSNIPESVSEEELQEMFSENGSISNFRFFPKDRRMALMQMSSVEEAIVCLIKLHNKKLNESSHLRVSFAKNEMQ